MIERIKSSIGKFQIVRSLDQAKDFVFTQVVALDIETHAFGTKLPGDSPLCAQHGLVGVSLCNVLGDARYFVINDRHDYGGILVDAFIPWLAEKLSTIKLLIMHNGKFDVGFLRGRGLPLNLFKKITWLDTHLFMTIRRSGQYASNKLKEIAKELFGVQAETKSKIDEYFEANKTKDFGDVPVEILAPYACDDVRYTLMIQLALPSMTPDERRCHDLYVENNQRIIGAELRGIRIDEKLMGQRMTVLKELMRQECNGILAMLGAAQVDPADTQAMLRYLHGNNLHPAPREVYGEIKFVYDKLFLESVMDHPLVSKYMQYHEHLNFVSAFGVRDEGKLRTRISEQDGCVFVHPSFWPATFSGGGVVDCRTPDFKDLVDLDNETRAYFIPRPHYKFVVCQAIDLRDQLIAYYTGDNELLQWLAQQRPASELIAKRLGEGVPEGRALLQNLFDGQGMAQLALKLKYEGSSCATGARKHYELEKQFKSVGLPGWGTFFTKLNARLASGGVSDLQGRVLKIPPEKHWRAPAILLQSSYGGLLASYLPVFCRLGDRYGARLVMAHRDEYVFEIAAENKDFTQACTLLANTQVTMPNWRVRECVERWTGVDDRGIF